MLAQQTDPFLSIEHLEEPPPSFSKQKMVTNEINRIR